MLEWAEATFVKFTKIQAWQDLWYLIWLVLAKLRLVIRCRYFHILNVLWQGIMTEQTSLCVCSCICYWHFMPDQAVYYFIEHFDNFLVSYQINDNNADICNAQTFPSKGCSRRSQGAHKVILWMSEEECGWSQAIAQAFFKQHNAYFQSNWFPHRLLG